MDSSDNVAGERSIGSHHEICDPEVEARLYGEIYYSNETWIRDVDEPRTEETTVKEPNVESVTSERTSVFDIENAVSRVESRNDSVCTPQKNIFQNSTGAARRGLSSEFPKFRYRIDNRPSREFRSANERFAERPVQEVPSTRETAEGSSTRASRVNAKTDAGKQRRPEKGTADRASLEIGRLPPNERRESKKKRDKRKKKKPNMKESPSVFVEIPSDSDDSILEVPVPPRAQPPLIQLVDSDDESHERGKASSTSPIKKSKAAKLCDEPPGRSNPNPDGICDETILLNVENPTSSGSSFRQNVASREEVGMIHAADTAVRANSDDSMTESEATNWINIAAGQADSVVNGEIFSVEESLLAPSSSFCDRSTFVRATEPLCNHDNPIGSRDRVPPGETNDALPNNTDSSLANDGAKSNETTRRRKRRKGVDSNSMEKSNTPRKKNKKNSCRTTDDGSLTDYFFKEMSKKLQAFYNDPWGSENLDVQRVQSTMPKNPRYWTILEADLSPVSKRSGKTCSRCGTNAHRGRRCPGKSVEPKCCMCGANGHLQTRCPQRMCLTCGRKYMTFRPTCDYCSNLYCYMCTGTGHTHEQCPDSWRKYHDTTSETLPGPRDPRNIMKAPKDLSCCNCAKRGHDSTMCKQLRWSQHFPTPMFVSSYSAGPIYPPLYREPPRDANNSVECVEMPDESNDRPVNEVLPMQRGESIAHDNVVYQCGNLNPSNVIDLQSVSKYLGKHDNVHTRGLLDGSFQPTFLNLWLQNFVFNVRIACGNDRGSILLVIEANSKDVLRGLEKLLMQWFARSDDEKPYLTYDVLPYENIKYLSDELRRKLLQIQKDPPPATLLRKLIVLEDTLRRTCGKLGIVHLSACPETKSARRRTTAIRLKLSAIMSQRCELVTSLYAGGWVPGSDVTLHSFGKLVDRLKSTKHHIRIDDYMEIVYLYNEIFTFHMSNGLAEALRRATTFTETSRENGPSGEGLQKQFVAWMDLNALDETIKGDSSGPNNNIHLGSQNGQIKTISGNNIGDSLPERREPNPSIFSNVRMENAPIAENFRIAKSDDTIATSSRTTAINEDYIRLEESMQHIHQLDSHRSQVLLINHYNKAKKKAKKKATPKSDPTLIKNMNKKQRKLHRRSAKAAIKVADSSCVTHLQRMAMTLKKKLQDNSVRHDDIKLLKNALIFERRKQHTIKYSKL